MKNRTPELLKDLCNKSYEPLFNISLNTVFFI